MYWTKQLPTFNGWYWWRQDITQIGSMARVTDACLVAYGRRVPLEEVGGEWLGPLVPPTGHPIEYFTPERRAAILAGYDGDACPLCGALKRVSAGSTWACEGCGGRGTL